jgi:hypothetical protein
MPHLLLGAADAQGEGLSCHPRHTAHTGDFQKIGDMLGIVDLVEERLFVGIDIHVHDEEVPYLELIAIDYLSRSFCPGARTIVSTCGATSQNGQRRLGYFGWRLGSPPGLPGGGITFISPVGGGGTAISGSTAPGGQMIPFDSESLSLRFGVALPTVGAPFADTSGGHAGFTE